MNGVDKKREKLRSNIDIGLTTAFNGKDSNTQVLDVDLTTAKIIIFSDHHRGTGDGADDFCDCAKAYSAALGYYLESGYTLILLGDAEDLWECRPGPVIQEYRNSLLLEGEFLRQQDQDPNKKRYYRIYGNHDDLWRDSKAINRYFQSQMPSYPQVTVTESMHLTLHDSNNTAYRFFLVHGHQGTLDSDRFGAVSRVVVRYVWRPLQRLFKFKSTTPAKNEELNSDHDIAMYGWALKQWRGDKNTEKAVLIAGHTHQPVFSSRSYVAKLREELAKLQKDLEFTAPLSGEIAEQKEKIAKKRAELEFARAEHGDSDDGGYPCYFNTGCCSFGDGDVTGIEIADGMIKLVRWPADDGKLIAKELEKREIPKIFEQLNALNQTEKSQTSASAPD
jgi:predicted phosphodiesterase